MTSSTDSNPEDEYADDEYADHDAEDREQPPAPADIPGDEPEADVLEQRQEVPVQRGRPVTAAAARQAELFPVWRYHAVFTDSPFEPVQAEGPGPPLRDHRIFVDMTDGPLWRWVPTNVAWLASAVIRHNLLRRRGPGWPTQPPGPVSPHLPRPDRRGATFTWHGGGHITLHLPDGWHRERQWINLLAAVCKATPVPT